MNSTEKASAHCASTAVRASRWSRLRLGAAGLSVAALLATTACGTVGQADDSSESSAWPRPSPTPSTRSSWPS